ncbi:MAG TPA: hypothetical protein PL193_04780 [Xanthobacteraceae bacterium]|nr:hypothetical protein [Xanthobacteraceae bacterium]
MNDMPPHDYNVGYGKPPVEHRFQPRNIKHLKRKKNHKREGILFRDLAAAAVKVRRKGSIVYVSRLQLLIDNHVAAAVRGDIRAAATLLKIHSRAKEIGDLMPQLFVIQRVDAKI